jgi:outer membrane protein
MLLFTINHELGRSMKYLPILAALAVAAAPAAARGQEAPRTLSLNEAVHLAREHNPAYRKVAVELTTARSEVRRAGGAFLPELTLSAGASGSFQRTFTGTNEYGEPVDREIAVNSRGSSTTQSLQFGTLTLFDGGQRFAELRAARAGYTAGEARLEAEALRMDGEVARRYFAAVQAERAIALEQALLDGAADRLETTRRLLRVGVRGPVDVIGAEVKVAEQEQALERARGEHRKALLALGEQIGRMDAEALTLTDDAPAPFDPGALDADALVALAAADHPRMDRALAAETAAGMRVRAARAARWPRLAASASMGRSQRFQGFEGLHELSPQDRSLGFNFSLQVPVFNGFRTSHQIQQAAAAREGAREDIRAERLALEREVRGALVDLENGYRGAVLAERTVALNRQRLALAQEQYRIGALTMAELHDAVEGTARAEREALRARFDFATALATLEEKVGVPVGASPAAP